jgi:aminopeptidase N
MTPITTYLKDYTPLPIKIPNVSLHFDLDEENTTVTNCMEIYFLPDQLQNIELNGALGGLHQMRIVSMTLHNQKEISNSSQKKELNFENFHFDNEKMTIPVSDLKDFGVGFGEAHPIYLTVITKINPKANTALEGLYFTCGIFCTQNEPEGFRRITLFLDRPDNLSRFVTTITADPKKFPLMLSNGNPKTHSALIDKVSGKHTLTWVDPFPKPSYLFALVAGDLGMIEDTFTTLSQRKVSLKIYCDKGSEFKLHHAMDSLKRSMKWDEDVFGLEYDLDIYMIVAIDAFNMGAMENKGLNIFNTSALLYHPLTSTDVDYGRVEGVVAHEYFHNWTGNRVTCRDWFQLTLKEGLTVFRDQQFSGDMGSVSVQRINDVTNLIYYQFREDSSPNSHPIKPKSYLEINNFYTATIYEKGAEVIRMIHTLIGDELFKAGMKLYFERFDGMAVTTEDFLRCMHDVSVIKGNPEFTFDYEQFLRWYDISGTPKVKVESLEFDVKRKSFHLKLSQKLSVPSGPLYIPICISLLDPVTGVEITKNQILRLTTFENIFELPLQGNVNFAGTPIVSINRNFSAPVLMEPLTLPSNVICQHLLIRFRKDSDPFNRYNAHQEYLVHHFKLALAEKSPSLNVSEEYFETFLELLNLAPAASDKLYLAQLLTLPSLDYLLNQSGLNPLPIDEGIKIYDEFIHQISIHHQKSFLKIYDELVLSVNGNPEHLGERKIINLCLYYLMNSLTETEQLNLENPIIKRCLNQIHLTGPKENMTLQLSALVQLSHSKIPAQKLQIELELFLERYKSHSLVINKWLSVQATSPRTDTLMRVKKLLDHPYYDKTIPNRVRGLLGSFAQNYHQFHHPNGEGYQFLLEQILSIDSLNPQVAATLMGSFNQVIYWDQKRKDICHSAINKLLNHQNLSPNLIEIAAKINGALG